MHEVLLNQTNDLLKCWLFLDGPLGLFEYFNPGITLNTSLHKCEICSNFASFFEGKFAKSGLKPACN